jgi:hypothetical protein
MGAQVCDVSHSFGACVCTGSQGGDMAGREVAADLSPSQQRVFVTTTAYASTAAASACQSSADAAGLGGTWVPWLSYHYSTNVDAIRSITSNGPWVLLSGAVAFRNRGQLGTAPSVPINVTEQGATLGSSERAWTGTLTGGVSSDYTCQAWTETRNSFYGSVGDPNGTANWTDNGPAYCGDLLHVYCFEP